MGAAVGAGKMATLYKSSLPIKKDFEEISLNRDPLYQTSACCTNFLLHLDTGFKRFRQYQKKTQSLSDGHTERKGIWERLFLSTHWEGAWMAFRHSPCCA